MQEEDTWILSYVSNGTLNICNLPSYSIKYVIMFLVLLMAKLVRHGKVK